MRDIQTYIKDIVRQNGTEIDRCLDIEFVREIDSVKDINNVKQIWAEKQEERYRQMVRQKDIDRGTESLLDRLIQTYLQIGRQIYRLLDGYFV